MGVHGLWKLIETSGKAVPLEALENRVLAVDVSIWLYQLVKGFQETSGHTVANAYLLGLFHRICKLLFYRIKPVFVFDGGVPALKKRTIADRQSNRNKANRHIEKLRQTLFENLAKQDALGQVLGESVILPKLFQPKQDNLFQLPPLPVTDDVESDGSSGESETELEKYRYKDIHSIDINSEEFLSLPPDMRHDILTELKETRKQSSWGKLHLIPKERNQFSDYQMQRLLKRRAVQVGIEKAESEMGTRGFTISDLHTILSDQGIDLAQRIAADNRTRLLYTDKSKESANENLKRTSSVNKSHKPMKRTKLIADENLEEIEDDPEICSSSEEAEDLSQKEILQLIKQENQFLTIHKGPDISPRNLDEFRNAEIGKEEALTVNDHEVENKTGNNVLKLERGNLPRERSPYQQSPPCLEALSQASTKLTNVVFPGPANCTNETNMKNLVQEQNIIKHSEDIFNPNSPETPKKMYLKNAAKSNASEQKKKRLEVLNYLNKVKEEITSPLKMPTLPDIKIKHEYISEESPLFTKTNSPMNKNKSETSDESESEVDEANESALKMSSSEFHVAKKDDQAVLKELEIKCSKSSDDRIQKFVSRYSDSKDQLIEVKSISSKAKMTDDNNFMTEKNIQKSFSKVGFNDINSKVREILDVQVPTDEVKKDSEESDSDVEFIEVKCEEEVEILHNDSSSASILKESPLHSQALEIVITSTDQLEDDLFAHVFQDMSQQKIISSEDEKKLEVSEKSISSIKSNSIHPENNEHDECLKKNEKSIESSNPQASLPSGSDKLALLQNNIDFPVEKEVARIPSPVPHFSTDEIMKMKRDLERESSDLMVEAQREDRIASTITEQIRLDAQELLQLFGIPYIIAPMEAEAQCAFLDLTGQTQGTITDDSDIWLFGGKNVYKNFFDQKKFVMQFKSTDIAKVLHLEREDMIMLALLTGSDYTLGLTGVGAVTALEIVAHYPKNDTEPSPFERLHHFAVELQQNKLSGSMAKKLKKASISEGFPCVEVINAYLEPEVDVSQEKFSWSKPNLNELRRYARDKFGWDKSRTDKILEPVLENLKKTQTQGTLHSFFDWNFDTTSTQRSKRVENAINLIKTSNIIGEPGPSRVGPTLVRNSLILSEADNVLPVKSKTPAQIAREKAVKKFKEVKKKSKVGSKSRKK